VLRLQAGTTTLCTYRACLSTAFPLLGTKQCKGSHLHCISFPSPQDDLKVFSKWLAVWWECVVLGNAILVTNYTNNRFRRTATPVRPTRTRGGAGRRQVAAARGWRLGAHRVNGDPRVGRAPRPAHIPPLNGGGGLMPVGWLRLSASDLPTGQARAPPAPSLRPAVTLPSLPLTRPPGLQSPTLGSLRASQDKKCGRGTRNVGTISEGLWWPCRPGLQSDPFRDVTGTQCFQMFLCVHFGNVCVPLH
jgi:hypothetical protein